MEKKQVISYKNLPARLPLIPTLVAWLLVREFDISGFWVGVMAVFLGLVWLSAIWSLATTKFVDIFKK